MCELAFDRFDAPVFMPDGKVLTIDDPATRVRARHAIVAYNMEDLDSVQFNVDTLRQSVTGRKLDSIRGPRT